MEKKYQLKARRMWANYYCYGPSFHYEKTTAKNFAANGALGVAIPVAVIPLDDVEAMIERAVSACFGSEWRPGMNNGDRMRAALTAIGVLPKSRKKGGRK